MKKFSAFVTEAISAAASAAQETWTAEWWSWRLV